MKSKVIILLVIGCLIYLESTSTWLRSFLKEKPPNVFRFFWKGELIDIRKDRMRNVVIGRRKCDIKERYYMHMMVISEQKSMQRMREKLEKGLLEESSCLSTRSWSEISPMYLFNLAINLPLELVTKVLSLVHQKVTAAWRVVKSAVIYLKNRLSTIFNASYGYLTDASIWVYIRIICEPYILNVVSAYRNMLFAFLKLKQTSRLMLTFILNLPAFLMWVVAGLICWIAYNIIGVVGKFLRKILLLIL